MDNDFFFKFPRDQTFKINMRIFMKCTLLRIISISVFGRKIFVYVYEKYMFVESITNMGKHLFY